MSLIRYSADDSRSVILRHQQTLVLFDPRSHEIVLREASKSPAISPEANGTQSCPFCKRPMGRHGEPDVDSEGPTLGTRLPRTRTRNSPPLAESGFVDQQYFRLLHSTVSRADVSESRRSGPAPSREIPRLKPEDTIELEDEGSSDERSLLAETGIKATAFSPGYYERFFETERVLGKGGKGIVLLVRHVLDGVSLGNFACKRVPVGNNHEWLEKVLIEVQLLQSLSNPNLVSYRHVWLEDIQLTNFGPCVPCAFILQQYCNSGDLHHFILGSVKQPSVESLKERLRRKSRGQPEPPDKVASPRKLPFEQIISFFRDIAQGLSYLHSNGFIHRDLKPSNCLLHDSGTPGQGLKVLISDFGEVQMQNEARKSTGTTGTISYCAPEVLRRVTPNGEYQNFTTKSDIFSLGMILHFVCFGKLPYHGADQFNEENEDLDALREEISAWKGLNENDRLRTDLPERLYHSLNTLISPDPTLRPSAEDILVGIEMGIGEEASPKRRGSISQKGASIIHDISFRRISPVADTPRSRTPVESPSNPTHQEYNFANCKGKGKLFNENQNLSINTRTSSKLSQTSTVEDSPLPSPLANESSLIIRPRRDQAEPPAPIQVPVLPSPKVIPRNGIRSQWITSLKIIIFFIKIVSLNRQCMPLAPNPCIFYPMIGLATLDFTARPLMLTTVLGIIHVLLLISINTFGDLCIY